jgi:toxin YoeB
LRVLFTESGWADYNWWFANDTKVLRRIIELIEDARRHPLEGKGKPKPLKGGLAGSWARRITQEHRLVYQVAGKGDEQTITIFSCRHHYS